MTTPSWDQARICPLCKPEIAANNAAMWCSECGAANNANVVRHHHHGCPEIKPDSLVIYTGPSSRSPEERKLAALESIARSLEKIANPPFTLGGATVGCLERPTK